MIYLFLANGFEEVEALGTLDVLRRAELEVFTVGVGEQAVTGSHGITVLADLFEDDLIISDKIDAVVLPGGMPGTLNLEKSETVNLAVDYAFENQKLLCAICAAPSILGHKGILKGKNAACFPGFESELTGAAVSDKFVCVDGKIITAKGMGSSVEFGLRIVEALKGKAASDKIRASLQIYNG